LSRLRPPLKVRDADPELKVFVFMNTPQSSPMVCDFGRSFVRWRCDTTLRKPVTVSQEPPTTLNDVRIPFDCLATVARGGRQDEFALSASCKGEQVFVERDVWQKPAADMLAISGAGQFMVIKRWDRANKGVMLHPPSLGPQPERQYVDPAAAFDSHSVAIRRRAGRRLDTIDAILEVLGGDREVVARTTFPVDGGEVTIEYPVKTVNYSSRHRYYQVDTGPVLFFGEPTGPNLIEHFHLAFIAHLGGDWAEFLVSRPTPLENFPVSVHHYSETRRVNAQNSLWVVEG
jgi:hypothetical protein